MKKENKIKVLLAGIIITHIIFVLLSMNQPFHGDEIVFSESAKAILEKGKLVFSYSQFIPNQQGLWHPPLYSYLISLFIAIFGKSIYAFRAVSAVFNIFTIILIYLISKEIFKNNKNKEFFSLLAVFLYALNPLTIQSSVVLDIDGGLLNFAIYLFLFLYIKGKRWHYLMPSLIFVFLSKETGPVVLFVSIILFKIMTKDLEKLRKTLALFLISGIIFLSIFWLYTHFFGLDFSMPFRHNFSFLGESSVEQTFLSSLMTKAWSLKTFFYFAIPFFTALFFIFSFTFYYKLIKKRETEKNEKSILLLNLFSITTIAMFFYLGASGWGFPKYYITALPGMAVFISYMISTCLKRLTFDRKQIIALIISSIIILFYFLLVIRSPLMPEFDATSRDADISSAIILIGKTFILYAILPFFICLFIFYIAKFKKIVLISLVFITIFLYLYLNSLHSIVDYSTYYTYGDKGVLQIIDYFKQRGISANQIAAYPHIGSYLGIDKYWEITFYYNNKKDFKEKIIDNSKIGYIVIYKRDIARIGENMDYFQLEKQLETYYIFKKIEKER